MSRAGGPATPQILREAGAVRLLLEKLIDYAGLFPPAGLGMPTAVSNFADYQRRPDAWALGRLVVPAARLAEFEGALSALPEAERLGTRWPITALLGERWAEDIAGVVKFNERHVHGGPQVLSLEARTPSIEAVTGFLRAAGPAIEAYCELPLGAGLEDLVGAVREAGGRAKIRAGGIHEGDFPAPELVLGFLRVTTTARVPFKATAGLHHPVRGRAPLTYAPDSPSATMFGYLNLFLAAALLWEGRPVDQAGRLLTAEGRASLDLTDPRCIRWQGIEVSREAIGRARQEYALAIGSCSFTEPLEEIDQ